MRNYPSKGSQTILFYKIGKKPLGKNTKMCPFEYNLNKFTFNIK